MLHGPRDVPAPLTVAASLGAVEGMVFLLLSVVQFATLSATPFGWGLSTAVFFLVFGVALLWCAWSLVRGRSWARSPVVLAQLIQVLLAWDFRHDLVGISVLMAVVALVVIVGILHPASVAFLGEEPQAP